jgi:hypothetical protein
MKVDRILPYYVGLAILSLFTGITYESATFVLRPFDVMMAFGVLLLTARASKRGYARRLEKGLPYYLFAALYLYRGLSGFVMTGPALAIKELIQGVEFVLLIHLVAHATKSEKGRREFLRVLFVGMGVISVLVAFLHIKNGIYSGYKYVDRMGYVTGGTPKYAFGLFGLLTMVFWMGGRRGGYTLCFAGAVVLVLLSGERKGWVALAASLIAVYYAKSNFKLKNLFRVIITKKTFAVLSIIVISLWVGSSFSYSSYQMETFERFYEVAYSSGFKYVREDVSGVNRYNGILFMFESLSEHPIFGIGTEQVKSSISKIDVPNVRITQGHGEYQRYAVENGLLGLALYLLTWAFIVKESSVYLGYVAKGERVYSLFVFGFVFYSIVVNLFMGGGAHNIMFLSVSTGVLVSMKNFYG